jgi:hypothetical protein
MGGQMTQIVNLRDRREDKQNLVVVNDVSLASIRGVELLLCIDLQNEATDELIDWMARCRWRVCHSETGQSTSTGKKSLVEIFDRNEPGSEPWIILSFAPLFPNLGELDMDQSFRIVLETPSGLSQIFFNTPHHSEKKESSEPSEGPGSRRKGKVCHLRVVK